MLKVKFFCLFLFLIPVQSVQFHYQHFCQELIKDWREMGDGKAQIHSNCNKIYVFFHGFEEKYNADWINRITEAMKHACAVTVDWKHGQEEFDNLKEAAENFESIKTAILPFFTGQAKFYVDGLASVYFFGFDIGAYLAAAVASQLNGNVKELHALEPTRVTNSPSCPDVIAEFGMPLNFQPENYFKTGTAQRVIVYRTSANADYGLGLVHKIDGTSDVQPFMNRDMDKEIKVCPDHDNCNWWKCLHDYVVTDVAAYFTLAGQTLTCNPEVEYAEDNPLYDEVPPKFYLKARYNADLGWEELTDATFVESVCGDVKVVFDQANYISVQNGMPSWIEDILSASSCVLYVDWNPNKHQNIHLSFLVEKLDDVAKRIVQQFKKKSGFPSNRNNIEFFGYDLGAYIAAKVAEDWTTDSNEKIKALYAIVPPTFGRVGCEIYVLMEFNRDAYFRNTNDRRQILKARDGVFIYNAPFDDLTNAYTSVETDLLPLGVTEFGICHEGQKTKCEKMICFAERVRDEVARRYGANTLRSLTPQG